MKHLKTIAFFSFLAFAILPCCGPKTPEYKVKLNNANGVAPELVFHRYEDVLFNLDTARFQEALMEVQDQYQPFLGGDLTDPLAVKYLRDFAVDTFSVALYNKVKKAYPDLSEVEEMLRDVYRHFNYYYPNISLPTQVYTCVSGIDPNVPPVIFFDDALVISLDWYLEGDDIYERIGMPQYRAERVAKAGLAKDLGQQIYLDYVQRPLKRNNLLEEMVEAGRMCFFVEAMYPELTDEVLLGYTSSQLQWAEDYEGDLWADMVGSQCLYASDLEVYRTFLADGPFTNEYSHEAPARLGEFVGLHIIRSFVTANPDTALPELMGARDLQAIFQDSHYKPKK